MHLRTIGTHVYNRQRKVKFDLRWLRSFTRIALEECLQHSNGQAPVLPQLAEVEIAIVSDPAIAAVHARFMQDPTPTDVITFEHGEILVSADTAVAYSQRFGTALHAELGLYVIHGLLHLNGFLDEDPRDAARMRKVQTRVLKACLERAPHEAAGAAEKTPV